MGHMGSQRGTCPLKALRFSPADERLMRKIVKEKVSEFLLSFMFTPIWPVIYDGPLTLTLM